MTPRATTVLALAALVGAGCATSGTPPTPRPFPAPGGAGTPALGQPSAIVQTALTLRGTPYRDGGADPFGFDCSGFVQYVFAQHAVALPRTVEEQYRRAAPVPRTDIRPGDLLFFTTVASGPSHVGIALGGGAFIHAPSDSGEVRIERLTSRYWATRLIAVRRPI